MRPLKIKMSAFMPYADEVQIDMEKLGTSGLYLVTGDTGAGKTTIFDAICYALYGCASGQARDNSMLRSKYAKDETPTEVELTFSHKGKEYTVKRNPEYYRPKKVGEGLAKETAKAYLFMPDGTVIDKIDTVNEKIREILCVDKEQFSQIAMIAQGDFLKLLHAETKVRQEIFRNLFSTSIYSDMQNRLARDKSNIDGKCNDAKKSVEQYVQGIVCNSEDILALEVNKAKAGSMSIEGVCELLDKLISSGEDKNKARKERLSEVEANLSKLNVALGQAQEIEKVKMKNSKVQELLESKKESLTRIKEEYEAANNALKAKDEYQKQIASIEAQLPTYVKLDEYNVNIKNLNSSYNGKKIRRDQLILAIENKEKEIVKLDGEYENVKNANEAIVRLNGEEEKIKERHESLINLRNGIVILGKKRTNEKCAQEKYITDNKYYMDIRAKYQEMDDKFRSAQAGVLASQLQEGKPCPVCGSLSHPSIAQEVDDCPTKEEVDELRAKTDVAHDEASKSSNEAAIAKSEADSIEERVLERAKEFSDTDSIEEITTLVEKLGKETSSKKAEIEKKLEEEKRKLNRKNELEKEIPNKKLEQKTMNEELAGIKENMAVINTNILSLSKQRDELKAGMKYENSRLAIEEINAHMRRVDTLNDEFEKAKRAYDFQNEEIKRIEGEIKGYAKTLKETSSNDIDKINDKIDNTERSRDELSKQIGDTNNEININKRCKDGILRKADELNVLEREYQKIAVLADTANGNLNGKRKITLEAFIQSYYFDKILIKANRRFLEMSGNHYELVRAAQSVTNRGKAGLELEVIDHYNGTRRSVRTLSGGESFMASLSLALGLSDEVSENAGGIKIDTLFIDEGFGSLDQETLQKAFAALNKLSDKSTDRLVGIISHVSELKEKIDRQIVVTKNKAGSSNVELII